MQMMFFYLFIITFFFTTRNVQSIKQNINYDDDLFYGDPLSSNKLQIIKLKDQFTKGTQNPSIPNIKVLNDYFTNYNSQLSKPTEFVTKEAGSCVNFHILRDLFSEHQNKKEIENNLNSISNYLNEVNYFFKDEYGNLLVFSVCKNLFLHSNENTAGDNENYIKCFQRFIFISKIDFSYYSFAFTGEKIPSLINFSVDFTVDDFTHKRYLFLFGGVDRKGNHNFDLYRFDIDYAFGNINVNKITSLDNEIAKNQFAPQGLTEASYNIIQYKKENLNYKKNYLSIIFGGNNDESISNKLYSYKHETSTWLTHDFIENKAITPRKGHSAVVTKRNLIVNDIVNEELISSYNVVIFGGKSLNAYLNDLVIIKVYYEFLNDKIYFKYLQLENNRNVVGNFPEAREGHKSFIEGDYLYIYGGCNYSIKKCYFDSIYKLNLKSSPFKWEKENINFYKLNEKKFVKAKINFNNLKTGEKISNLIPFKSAILSIGVCEKHEDNCKNELNLIMNQTVCLNEKQEQNDVCFLDSENNDHKFNWVYQCKKKQPNTAKISEEISNHANKRITEINKIKDSRFRGESKDKREFRQEKIFDNNNNKKEDVDKKNIQNSFLQLTKSANNQDKNKDKIDEKALSEKLLKLFRENFDLNNILVSSSSSSQKNINKSNQSNENADKILFEKFKKFAFKLSNSTNHKFKNKSKKARSKSLKEDQLKNENELLVKFENKLSQDFKNTTLKIFEVFDNKIKNYLNATENSNHIFNKNIEKTIKDKFDYLEKENLRLKKLIYNSEIKPLLKENLISNASINEINFLNFEEKILNVSKGIKLKNAEDFKEKTINAIKRNCALTKNLQKNITNIKTIIDKENKESRKNLNSLLKNLLNKIEGIDAVIEKKFHRVSEFIKNQERINNSTKEFLRKQEYRRKKVTKQCFNGFLVNETFCQCSPGFSGENCEIILTCEDDCSKNGVCHYGKCFCNPGFSGTRCENKEQCSNNCNNRGKCHLGQCYCDYGFSGSFCENKISCKNDCSNKGICYRGKCLCEPGWSGDDCSILAVKFNGCKNDCNKNGVCKMEKCFCYPGFSGKYCEIKNKFWCPTGSDNTNNSTDSGTNFFLICVEVKTNVPCSGNGLCKYGICFCFPGFRGKACDKKEICKANCNNNGICIKGKCHCRNNLKTEDCSEEIKTFDDHLNKNINNTEYRKLNDTLLTKKKKKKELLEFSFRQIDNQSKKMNSIEYADLEIKNAIKADEENGKDKDSIEEREESKLKHTFSIVDEKTGVKYDFNPEGIYVGKETIEKLIYTALIILLLICSIILTMYLNKKFSTN